MKINKRDIKLIVMFIVEVVLSIILFVIGSACHGSDEVAALKEFYTKENQLLFNNEELSLIVENYDDVWSLIEQYGDLRLNLEFCFHENGTGIEDIDAIVPDNISNCEDYVRFYIYSLVDNDKLLVANNDSDRVIIYQDYMLWLPLAYKHPMQLVYKWGAAACAVIVAVICYICSYLIISIICTPWKRKM